MQHRDSNRKDIDKEGTVTIGMIAKLRSGMITDVTKEANMLHSKKLVRW